MTDTEADQDQYDALVAKYGLKLMTYCSVLSTFSDLYYVAGDDADGPAERKLLAFFSRRSGTAVQKMSDCFEKITSPPLDAFSPAYVYEFKTCYSTGRFGDLDRSVSGGAFVDKFKLEHLDLACGRILCRFPDPKHHFSEGYYVYIDKEQVVYCLSAGAIRSLIEEGKTKPVKDWMGGKRDGWMIPTRFWNCLGAVYLK